MSYLILLLRKTGNLRQSRYVWKVIVLDIKGHVSEEFHVSNQYDGDFCLLWIPFVHDVHIVMFVGLLLLNISFCDEKFDLESKLLTFRKSLHARKGNNHHVN